MRFEIEPSHDLGLQHVLQNGLRIVTGNSLGEERDAEVLEDLREIVSEADRGSESIRAESLTFSPDGASAVERFSLFYRYLDYSTETLTERLASAKDALERLGRQEKIGPDHQEMLAGLFRDLLASLQRQRALTPPPVPRELNFQ